MNLESSREMVMLLLESHTLNQIDVLRFGAHDDYKDEFINM